MKLDWDQPAWATRSAALTLDLRGFVREALGDARHLRAERAQLQLDRLVYDFARASKNLGRS